MIDAHRDFAAVYCRPALRVEGEKVERLMGCAHVVEEAVARPAPLPVDLDVARLVDPADAAPRPDDDVDQQAQPPFPDRRGRPSVTDVLHVNSSCRPATRGASSP